MTKHVHLTRDEINILKYAAQGLENAQIGKLLFISRHTVKAHLAAIYRKFNAVNRTNAVYLAYKNGYIN